MEEEENNLEEDEIYQGFGEGYYNEKNVEKDYFNEETYDKIMDDARECPKRRSQAGTSFLSINAQELTDRDLDELFVEKDDLEF